jgi:hypothetical protein
MFEFKLEVGDFVIAQIKLIEDQHSNTKLNAAERTDWEHLATSSETSQITKSGKLLYNISVHNTIIE